MAALFIVASVAAMAEPSTTTITVPAGDSHSYAVYQIFTGELADGKLSNVKWGKNGTGTEGQLVPKTTLDAIAAITGTDEEKAEALAAYANLTGTAAYTVTNAEAINVPTGYYLIKDNAAIADGDEATLYIVQVVGPTTIARKAGTTTSDKTVDDVNDSDTTDTGANAAAQTSADYDIGDDVPFHLTATLSEKVEQYDSYKIVFEDILESGKFDAISALTVKVNNVAIGETADYTVATTEITAPTKDGFKIQYVFTPKEGKTLASLNSAVITIDFTAKLGTGAQIGGDGNSNTLKVTYSNNPNSTDEGHTPDKDVTVFTFKIIVNKVDGNNNPLANAGFTLYKVSKADAEAGVTGVDAAAKNAAWAAKAIKTFTTTAVAPSGSEVASQFNFEGLDDGYYVLCETTTPAGYNTWDPQAFKVEATHTKTAITALSGTKINNGDTITFEPNTGAGSLTTTIQNQQGSTLPSTGGIGTTLFYVGGGILVLLAVVLLVTKKRMGAND